MRRGIPAYRPPGRRWQRAAAITAVALLVAAVWQAAAGNGWAAVFAGIGCALAVVVSLMFCTIGVLACSASQLAGLSLEMSRENDRLLRENLELAARPGAR